MDRKDVPRAQAEWDQAIAGQTDAAWAFPLAAGFKVFWNPNDFPQIMSAYYGQDFAALWGAQEGLPAGFWNQDEGGSLNAVCGLLRSLGVRWFMPGEIGQVVPELATIAVGPRDELYVQSRFLWDADHDVDQVLNEYCTLFYRPAAKPMKEAIDFAEQNLAYKDQSRSRGRGNPSNVPLRSASGCASCWTPRDRPLATRCTGAASRRSSRSFSLVRN